MNTDLIHQQLQKLLIQLAQELKNNNLWQQQAPSVEALSSTAPFCYDTLSFAQWLQFIFLKRMQIMVQSKTPLPSAISLCPMAEEAFKQHDASIVKLITIIADIDELLSGKREQTRHE
ncbi:YqcC family protein [Thalassomonas sp. M1454]|uniref:YqcC family protein n=1 Tax=Thalassomonas sp. M1454 TaxID=2594477 RepID=UPI00117D7B1C|nr:YqcC family protein [Thalassomonas sp. M1454]TRX56391.1 YqcC family protein [Thalassomonas sp. M1454]